MNIFLQDFVRVIDDIRAIIPFLDNPYLIDKYGLITLYGGTIGRLCKRYSIIKEGKMFEAYC
jgi:hypothetical protein